MKNKLVSTKSKQQTGFVSKFGADVPVDIKFDLDSVHNLRVSKGNATLSLLANINIEFWVNNGTSSQALDLLIKNCVIYF